MPNVLGFFELEPLQPQHEKHYLIAHTTVETCSFLEDEFAPMGDKVANQFHRDYALDHYIKHGGKGRKPNSVSIRTCTTV